MPVEALWSRGRPVPFDACPNCGSAPFEPFMRGQVARFDWFGLRRKIWALICYRCKEIVDHERIDPPEAWS